MVKETITSLSNSVEGRIAAGLAVILFIWMYIRTALQLRMGRKEQLERLQQSLLLYSRVNGPLGEMMDRDNPSSEEISHLIYLLEECKAAPLLTSDLNEQINVYIKERDHSRLWMLHKAWMREVNQRIEEQSTLLRQWDHPSWGTSFWLLLKPTLPFVAVIAILLWSFQLSHTLSELSSWAYSPWDIVNAWARFISCFVATASLYIVFMYTRRKPYHPLYIILYVLISVSAIFHTLGLNVALYIVAIQAILYLTGFSLTTKRTRKERPYAGRDLVMEIESPFQLEEPIPVRSTARIIGVPSTIPSRSKRMHGKDE
jgi:hypothetical protein